MNLDCFELVHGLGTRSLLEIDLGENQVIENSLLFS